MNRRRLVLLLLTMLTPIVAVSDFERIVELKQKMAESLNQGSLITKLTSQGIAPSDAEMIAAKFAQGIASCFVDAMVENAVEKSVALDRVLDAFESTLSNKESAETLALIDKDAVEERAMPCAHQVAQDAGVNMQ